MSVVNTQNQENAQKRGFSPSFVHFLDILPRFRGKNLPLATGSTVFKAGFGKFLRVVDVAAIDDEGILIIPDWRRRRSGIIIVKRESLNFPPKIH